VIGTGLIGASFALAARAAGCLDAITDSDRNPERLAQAVAVGAIDPESAADVDPAIQGAEAVLVAVPVGRVAGVVADLAAPPGTTVFDVGSAKQTPLTQLRERLGEVPANFVPCHPMAGSERSGPAASSADMFQGRTVYVTPQMETGAAHLERVRGWWEACGAEVQETTAEHHDRAVALTSHVPHLLAAAFVSAVADGDLDHLLDFAGPGYADFTRIAGGDAALWRDILASNRDAVLTHLETFLDQAQTVREQLQGMRLDELEQTLVRANRLQVARGGAPGR
jgi:prephenate dehydrogenase